MSVKDISRFLFQPQKRYSSVRMQQGRVMLDSDWNESERIDDEQARRRFVDVICSHGTPNEGFLVGTITGEPYDFPLASGSFYLGGLRFEAVPEIEERFRRQTDWLQIDANPGNLPSRPSVEDLTNADGTFRHRYDLVYLRGWEQCVTAVEDSELRERALGGPDTSVRMRLMRLIEVLPDVPGNCPEAFSRLKARLTAPRAGDGTGESHSFDDANCELRSKATLTVGFSAEGITEDPCKPNVIAGFLGAENQTFRLQLTATNRFIWGYDNASPLYRVQVLEEAGQAVKIKFLTLPRDQAAQPLKGQAVEILPWSAFLPNQEKVAELQGHLATVATSFNPEEKTITISKPVPQAWIDWFSVPEHAQYLSKRDPDDRQKYFYLRLWTGGSGDADEPDHGFTPGDLVELTDTGFHVTFSKHGLPGDFWIIAARPNTPDLVVPWELMKEASPAGTRVFFAPLALVRWSVVGADPDFQVTASVEDCRHKFRSLCEVGGCCTVTVGDGVLSHGDFNAIEAAIAYLPSTGGEVCLLPGLHQANVTIARQRNITIKGCDQKTQVIPRESSRESPIFRVIDSHCITLEHMDLVTLGGTAIVLQDSELGALQEIDIHHNRILAYQQAIQVGRGVEVNIDHNRLRMLDKEGAGVAISCLAEDSLIECNDIGVVPPDQIPPPEDVPEDETPDPADPCADLERVYTNATFLSSYLDRLFSVVLSPLVPATPYKALGGIQIAAASERLKVLENTINGGAGNGITLGGALVPILPTPEGEGEEAEHVIAHTGQQIWGGVAGPAGNLPGISLVFTRVDDSGAGLPAMTDPTGMFLIDAESGNYSVTSTTPGYRIQTITPEVLEELGVFQRIEVTAEEPKPEDLLAFLYEIEIDCNEIANMGLSGIGIPRPAPRQPIVGTTTASTRKNQALAQFLALLGNPIVTLGIHRNHIHDCLRNPFDDALRAEARQRGFGGISLGFCENVTISGNRIERNGISHINPVCGIFITRGEVVDIHHNLVAENGPMTPDGDVDLERGIRGGIVLLVFSFGFVSQDFGQDTGRHAARIHDNVVHQPAGQALRLLAIGPISVCNNRFNAGLSGPDVLERLAGVVLISNAGSGQRLPDGTTLFNSNQSHLGSESASLASQIIMTVDDLGFDANQSVALGEGIALTDTISFLINTMLSGATLRASDNRLKEPSGGRETSFKASLLSLSSLMNNTSNNQGDHCIFAFGTAVIATGNQILDDTLCPRIRNSVATPVANFAVVPPLRV